MAYDTKRSVSACLTMTVSSRADIVAAVAIAEGPKRLCEEMSASIDQRPLQALAVSASHGGRLHYLNGISPGRLTIEYSATVTGSAPAQLVAPIDGYRYGRPSRFCQSDELGPMGRGLFGGLNGLELLDAVSGWIRSEVTYLPGHSRPTDGAVATVLSRAGVCRDFAHLAAAFLRANGVPTRIASVYAPGLTPMDFHAVVEACVDGQWWVVDPTARAPRQSLLRIATGLDATDTAFITVLQGQVHLDDLEVRAIVEPWLPDDDHTGLAILH